MSHIKANRPTARDIETASRKLKNIMLGACIGLLPETLNELDFSLHPATRSTPQQSLRTQTFPETYFSFLAAIEDACTIHSVNIKRTNGNFLIVTWENIPTIADLPKEKIEDVISSFAYREVSSQRPIKKEEYPSLRTCS